MITGGCGFIGSNAAHQFRQSGHEVVVIDNLSRRGSSTNLEWLNEHGHLEFTNGDICDEPFINESLKWHQPDVCIHLAAQVAVTTSVTDPRRDFEINALGTFNVLEAIRKHSPQTILLNASTNKVYGKLGDLEAREGDQRYSLPDLAQGVSEAQPLDFHSPYGCSKGAADQYVTDYARIYGLRTVNFRQSCIYGKRQFGVEDQGWVAWFTIAHFFGEPITIYGNGKQVRDILFVDDLIDCYLTAIERIDQVSGMTFNIGGGPPNTLSLLELLDRLAQRSGRPVRHTFEDWRPGDQPIYVSDIRSASRLLGWQPKTNVDQGLDQLFDWIVAHENLFLAHASHL
jgi:CDP-paratose 2-epimerase